MAMIQAVLNDTRYACRMLRKNLGFTLAAAAILAMGIGLNTSMFTVLDALIWRALPYPQPNRLMSLEQRLPSGETANAASYPDFLDWKKSRSFESVVASSEQEVVLAGPSHPDRAFSEFVTPGYFSLLGLRPQLGRTFSPAEAPAGAPVAVISHELWTSHFGNSKAAIGQSIQVNDRLLTVVGVLAPGAAGLLRHTAIWIPIGMIGLVSSPELLDNRAAFLVQVVGRLPSESSLATAKAEFRGISKHLQTAYPETNQGREVALQPLFETRAGPLKDAVFMLFGSVTLFLMIACFNVANLFLSKYIQRQREIAIRRALGASGAQLLRQFLIEGLLISSVGAAGGLLLAAACLRLIGALELPVTGNSAPVAFNWITAAYGVAVSLFGGLLVGALPALRFSKGAAVEALRGGARAGSSRWSAHTRDLLVFSQVVIATVLFIGSGLMLRSLARLYSIDPGFRGQKVTAVDLGAMPPSRYPEPGQLTTYYWNLLERLQRLPGIQTVGASMRLPLSGPTPSMPFVIKGGAGSTVAGDGLTLNYTAISPDYLLTAGIPLSGRSFTERDTLNSQPVVIVNAAIARKYWPGRSPIGDYLKISDGETRWRQIVGVAGDVRSESLTRAADPAAYVPFAQIPAMFSSILRNFPMSFVLKSEFPTGHLAPLIRKAVVEVDRDQVVLGIFPLGAVVTNALSASALYTQVLGLFGVGALLLASAGIYGVVSQAVLQRTRELGVRLALGATPANVLGAVLSRALGLIVPAAALGLLTAFVLTRLMASLLFGIDGTDPVTFASGGLCLIAVGLLASLAPALRAAFIDPKTALRQE